MLKQLPALVLIMTIISCSHTTIVFASSDPDELPKCDGSYRDCTTEEGYFCEAGSTSPECECDEEMKECANYPLLQNDNDNNSCYKTGYDDGRDHPFDRSTFEECDGAYYEGFIEGCMSVEGNTRDVCESASDA